jgi:hypothetical protein
VGVGTCVGEAVIGFGAGTLGLGVGEAVTGFGTGTLGLGVGDIDTVQATTSNAAELEISS